MLRRAWIAWAAAATVLAGCSAGDYDGDFEKPAPAVPPTLTVQAGPAASTAPWTTPLTVSNSQTCAPVLQLTLTAGPTEDIRVDSIRFSVDTSLVPVGTPRGTVS
jgi:hypothetical protein